VPIDLDSITIGEAKRLVAQLAPLVGAPTPSTAPPAPSTAPPAEAHPLAEVVGCNVVVRDNRSGVVWGRVQAVGWQSSGGAWLVLAPGARQGHYWHARGACPGLAACGPVATPNTRYCAPAPGQTYYADLVGVYPTTPEADAAWAAMPVWGGQ